MGMNVFPLNTGTDWSKYTPVQGAGTVTGVGSYQTVVDITGKGYLAKAVIANGTGIGTPTAYIKVTIDGVLKHYTRFTYASRQGGGLLTQDFLYNSTVIVNGTMTQIGTAPIEVPYPTTNGSEAGVVVMPMPIFFDTSLKIEVQVSSDQASGYEYKYAVI